jgi:hypothetical protein
MNQEDIIRMAKEAGVKPMLFDGKWAIANLDTFAKQVAESAAKAEREACAKVCEDAPEPDGADLAARIRARGKE